MLINQPQVWSAIFVTQKDPRSFVEACLERSHPTPLDVTMNAGEVARVCPDFICDRDDWGRLLSNEMNPCEWHFQFGSLVEPGRSHRIRGLDIDLDDIYGYLRTTRIGKLSVFHFILSPAGVPRVGGWGDGLRQLATCSASLTKMYNNYDRQVAYRTSCGARQSKSCGKTSFFSVGNRPFS